MPLEDESSRSETNVVLSLEAKSSTLLKYNKHKLDLCNKEYIELLTELFFLQHGGNYVDFAQFKKRPSQQLLTYIEQNPILSNGCHKAKPADEHSKPVKTSNQLSSSGSVLVKKLPEVQKQEPIWKKVQPKDLPDISLPEGYEETIGSQEEILERARQEAIVQRRVIELRKQGQWSQRRLPKVREPTRTKTHWDYLLEEMRWLATDFAQERKWKLVTARKVARMVANYHKDSHEREKRAAKEEQQKLRRIASNIARQIRLFWADIQKVVEYKQQCLLDEKRQKALDLHLNFIVDQTAKYSDWLSQGLKSQSAESGLPSPSSQASTTADSDNEFLPQGTSTDDEETIAKEETADPLDVQDEIAMLKQESEMPFEDLISQLPKDLIDNIDKPFNVDEVHSSSENKEPTGNKKEDVEEKIDYSQEVHSEDASDDARKPSPISLRRSARKRPSEDESEVASKKIKTETEAAKDVEFVADQSSSDDEETLKEQEEAEEVDHEKEIKQLQAESDMPIEELVKMYGQVSEGSDVLDAGSKETSPPSSEGEDGSADDSDNDDIDDSDNDDNVDTEIGMDYLLLENDKEKDLAQKDVASENKELDDVAAEALSLQPTGHTLATTQVVTPIPSLLKHTLREYQHIGLDWLVTMYNKRLNGILADEMGLGKTIQTIALLAHLACEKGVWGPHLIVVPTSVILNWEMELKKWAPGFKILTYYGSQKERKLKRTGWTKSNAFHVCITSYKLILQDHSSFRRKKWRYLILDEAQNIKNFKSQRWQALLNFNSQRRLLLTGTPLQNNLMELWSLMHFLMPHVFQSHKEFKEWFSNPMSGMIEGTQEFNEGLVQRLHQVLRPFILRRIKKDVEKQMPNKYEHVVRCQLSKRQRFLYDDFMSRAATKETLAGGHFMSVINVLMQLRKVCNHPNLFEPRPTVSPLSTDRISYHCPSIINKIVEKDFFQDIDVVNLNLHLPSFTRFTSHDLTSLKRLQVRKFNVNKSTQDGAVKAEKSISESIRTTIRNKILHLSQSEIAAVRLGISSNGSYDEDKPPPEKKVKPTPTEGWSMERVDHARYCDVLVERDRLLRNDTFDRIARINRRRCSVVSTYMPADVLQLLTMDVGLNIFLSDMLKTAPQRLEEMSAILDRYVLFIPKASTLPVHFQVPHPSPWRYYSLKSSLHGLRGHLSRHLTAYHRIRRSNVILLPETRLIEYDCGKLQVLNILLRRFWSEKHRILIFTQMTKVLDILEMFLNYHGYRYLRLDGSTPVEERMGRMERFNNDPRIFCFILSTRSGGIGVNLTGADTVVFYDSDWNPTMDAQAQDRCHRIGQTRDVHIYRLISEKTIEENILKKANQKRLLGDLAIEGGEFTTTFFKQNQIKDLFDDPTGLDDLLESSSSQSLPEDKEKGLEKVLLETEEREDVEAAALLQREQDAMMEEFQDSNPAPPTDGTGFKIPKGSKIKDELYRIYNELSPVERYALTFIELSSEAVNDMQLQEAEEKVEQSKKEWELAHMMALKEEEERRMEEADDEIFYTREDNQVFVDLSSGEIMPSWFPPTPPRDDVYMDDCCSLLYDTQKLMSLESLSNVLVKKKIKHPSKLDSKFKSNSRVDIKAPKSLFNRQFGIKKKEKMKHKNPSLQPPKLSHSGLSPVKTERLSSPPPGSVATSDWILNEDWRLIQTVQQVLEIPLSLVTNMPAHTANWELVADSVNMVSSIYRSAKECRQRFDRLVINLDESKVLTPRKKLKSVSKFPVKNSQARFHLISHNLVSDNNSQFSALYSSRFDACRTICSKRIPPKTAAGTGQFQRNPKHTNILQVKCGINYDNPLHPMQVAAARVKRLANQKKASTEQHVVANVAPPTTPVNVPATLPPGSIQHIGGAIITSGTSVLGKTTIPVNATGLQHLAAAIPLSGGHSNIVVHPSFSRKISTVQGAVPKVQAGKVNPSHAGNPDQHLTIQQPIHSVSLSFPAQSSLVTFATAPTCISTASVRPSIAYPSRGVSTKLSAVQHIKQMKTSTPVKQQPTLTHQQLVLHQHMLKQRQIPQHQQRQVVGSKSLQQKSVLPPGSTHHLLVCAATTPGKMTSQSTVQMINQMVAQQRQQRRLPAKTAVVQAPVTLTVTKLLQSSSNIRHTLLTQNPQVSLQSSQPSVLSVSANNIVMGSASTQQQVISSQHRQFHMAQISQPRASSSSPVVASTPIVMHRPSVVAIGNPLSQLRLRTPTPVSQMVTSTNHPRSSGVEPVSSASMVVSHLPSSEGK